MSTHKHTVRLLTIAEQDLQDLLLHVAADNVTAALVLVDRIEKNLNQPRAHPYLGKVPNDKKLAHLHCRFLVVDNYLLFYKILGKTVLVYRIIHRARDVPTLLTDFEQN